MDQEESFFLPKTIQYWKIEFIHFWNRERDRDRERGRERRGGERERNDQKEKIRTYILNCITANIFEPMGQGNQFTSISNSQFKFGTFWKIDSTKLLKNHYQMMNWIL